jgi:integrin alpha FG-GAP repeat containing protein 1
MPGGVWKFTLTDRKGAKSPAMGCQLTQSAYAALQTPYVYFGLGQVSNYIDTLFYGVSIANSVSPPPPLPLPLLFFSFFCWD